MKFKNPIQNLIPDKSLRIIIYILLSPIALGLLIFLHFLVGLHLIFGVFIVVFAYKNISEERLKWIIVTILTLSVLILGSLFNPIANITSQNKNETTQSQANPNPEEEIESEISKEEEVNNLQNTQNIESPKAELKTDQTSKKPEVKAENEFLVTKVIDGDTIEIEGGQRVRYIGIDTPETVDPNRPVGCYGKEASSKNSYLVLNKKVKLVKDVSETDRYGRLLRYVYIGDTFVNDFLVKEGYAKASTYAPDVKFSEQFAKSEREARENKKGLWSDSCTINTQETKKEVKVETQINNQKSNISDNSSKESSSSVVKKSNSNICHAPGTTYYEKTKNFTPYDSVEDCINSGGRLPKR